jgi:hypothetical protein
VEIRQGRVEAWVHVSMDPNTWLMIQESLHSSWYEKVFYSRRGQQRMMLGLGIGHKHPTPQTVLLARTWIFRR